MRSLLGLRSLLFIKNLLGGFEEQNEPAEKIINRLEVKKNYIPLGPGP
jgi:hypothetical protein